VPIGQVSRLRTREGDDTDRAAVLHHRNRNPTAIIHELRYIAKFVVGIREEVGHLLDGTAQHCPSRNAPTVWSRRKWGLDGFDAFLRNAVVGYRMNELSIELEDEAIVGLAQPCRTLRYRVENRLGISWRA
jgi:hypothetical protein